ncbi:MAG TPA: hypothetical protein GX724_01215 [Fibrobacter sp.]|nr:hypothetical protein [Fibrobacter sp.]
MKFLFLFLSFLALSGCDFPWSNKDPVIVTVGDVKLKTSDLRAKVAGWDTLSNREQIVWVESWIDEEVLYQEALNHGIQREKRIRELLYLTERKIVVESFIARMTDSLSVDAKDARLFYDAHPEHFLYNKWLWSGFIVSYTDWKWASNYYKSKGEKIFNSLPDADFRLKNRQSFDSLAETPDSCLSEDLRELPIGTLSSPKLCGGLLKSIVITHRQDSAAVIPFEQVKAQAEDFAQLQKQRDLLSSLKTDLKKKRPIFSNPKLFYDSSDQKRNK